MDICPIFYVADGNDTPQHKEPVVFPFIGDLLLFLQPPHCTPYCINISVKDSYEDFTKPGPRNRTPSDRDRQKALARHQLESEYYKDADIPTIHVAREDIDDDLAANVRTIYASVNYALSDTAHAKRSEIVEAFRFALSHKIPPLEVMIALEKRGWCQGDDAINVFYQAIWYRELRVNLFKPILPDYPLQAEQVDLLNHFSHWFAR